MYIYIYIYTYSSTVRSPRDPLEVCEVRWPPPPFFFAYLIVDLMFIVLVCLSSLFVYCYFVWGVPPPPIGGPPPPICEYPWPQPPGWLSACQAAWLPGSLAGCLAAWLPGRLPGGPAARLPGCVFHSCVIPEYIKPRVCMLRCHMALRVSPLSCSLLRSSRG